MSFGGRESAVLAKAGITGKLPNGAKDPGFVLGGAGADQGVAAFAAAVAAHRTFARETDPPRV